MSSIKDSLEAQGLSLSILIVDYPLTPVFTFPTQFQEAVNAVRYVLETCDFEPSQIIIGGDSAGGNLAAAVVLHCIQPSDHVAPLAPVSPVRRFRGLILLSPWVSFDVTLQSFTKAPGKDYIQAESEKTWSDSYLNKSEPCIYSEPGLASANQWKDIPVQDILVTTGADEVLLDGITTWVDHIKVLLLHCLMLLPKLTWKFQVHNSNITYNIAPNEPHEAPIIWSAFGGQRVTETERKVDAWLKRCL